MLSFVHFIVNMPVGLFFFLLNNFAYYLKVGFHQHSSWVAPARQTGSNNPQWVIKMINVLKAERNAHSSQSDNSSDRTEVTMS